MIKNSTIYIFANLIASIVPFVLLPVLTRYLNPEEYGQVAMFQVLMGAFVSVVGLNVVGSATRNYYSDEHSEFDKTLHNSVCLHVIIISGLVITLVGALFRNEVASVLHIKPLWVPIASICAVNTVVITLLLSQWQVREKPLQYGAVQILYAVLNLIFTITGLIYLELKEDSRIDAILYSSFFVSMLCLNILISKRFVFLFKFSKIELYKALAFGVPLVLHSGGGYFIASVDRVFITNLLGVGESGVYLAALQVSMVMNILLISINNAYVPWLFESLRKKNKELDLTVIKNTYLWFLILILIMILSFYIGPWVVTWLLGESFIESSALIGLLVIGQCFGGMYLMVTNYIFYVNKTMHLSLVTFGVGVISLALMYFFTSWFGLKGAAFAFCISMFFKFLFTWILAMNVYKMPWMEGLFSLRIRF